MISLISAMLYIFFSYPFFIYLIFLDSKVSFTTNGFHFDD